jgi:hypothetical protein
MLRALLTLTFTTLLTATTFAAKVGVQLYDMYRTEMVYLMTSEEVRELKADLSEEKRVFNKAFTTVKRQWTKDQTAALKAGNKDYPKFPTKTFIWVRDAKYKNFSTDDAANEWYAKQKKRLDAEMSAKAAAAMEAIKAAKGSVTAGYKSRDDKKERKRAEKAEMSEAAKEKIGELIELEMMALIKYNRPVPKHFIYDPVAGADKNVQKKMDKQDEAIKLYKQRKAEAEAAAAAGETTPAPAQP